jgi:hypothetical protein
MSSALEEIGLFGNVILLDSPIGRFPALDGWGPTTTADDEDED